MAVKIDQKIKGYTVVTADDKARENAAPVPAASIDRATAEAEAPADNIIHMHERIERPEVLIGSTYKIKSPLVEHAIYVTINDIVLNAGTEHEQRRPFEIFINSKSMEHFQWIVALTRIMSAVFRKGGDVTFLVDEMKAVFDPKGGYFKAGGVYMPSIVAELGAIVEQHLKMIGLLHDPDLDPEQRRLIAEKRAAYEARVNTKKKSDVSAKAPATVVQELTSDLAGLGGESARKAQNEEAAESSSAFPPSASMCNKCNTKAMILMDGCATCLNCGYSKCG